MKIGVCGCGWLGLPLALKLQSMGHNIIGTRRSVEAVMELESHGISGLQYSLGDELSSTKLQPLLEADLIILNIPPGRKSMLGEFFSAHMVELIHAIGTRGESKLIFISTTSVYGDTSGNITEQTPVNPNTESGKAHVQIEQTILEQFAHRACVIRLAGLVGENRHPAKYLAGRTGLFHGEHAVNLIHQLDVIKAIEQIIKRQLWGETLHLCSTDHPSRIDYYSWAATKLGLQTPEFVSEANSGTGKQINPKFSLETLDLNLQYPSPFDMLN